MKQRSPLLIIFLTVFLDLLGFGIVLPQLPLYGERFGASGVVIGLLFTAYSLMQFVFAPLWGGWSDRVGRRPVILISVAGSGLSYLLFGLAHSLPLLFVSRLLAGLCGANISAAQAYIADVTTAENRSKGMGLIGAAFGLGFIFGPALGGELGHWGGNEAIGFCAAGLNFLNLLFAFFALPESLSLRPIADCRLPIEQIADCRLPIADCPESGIRQIANRKSQIANGVKSQIANRKSQIGKTPRFRFRALREVLGLPTIGLLLGLFFCATFAFANLETTFTLFAHRRYDLTEQGVGRIFGYIGLWVVVVQGGLIGPLTRALGEKRLVVLGLSLLGLGLFLLPEPHGLGLLHLVLIPIAVGNGLNTPSLSSLISQYSPAERRGEVLGAAQSLSSLARILGPLWGNYLLTHGLAWPYLVAGALMMGTALLSLRLFRSPVPTEAGETVPLQPALSEAGHTAPGT